MKKDLQKMIEEMNKEFGWFNQEELQNTAGRINRFFKEWQRNKEFKFTVFDNPGYDQMIILKDIEFYSLCSHHLLPFIGKAHIAYIPDKKICGISKLARVVDKFASKPQIQEQLTNEIINFIEEKLKPKGVMVVIEAQHLCMKMRGVKKYNSTMVTSAIKGVFEEDKVRQEFLNMLKR